MESIAIWSQSISSENESFTLFLGGGEYLILRYFNVGNVCLFKIIFLDVPDFVSSKFLNSS